MRFSFHLRLILAAGFAAIILSAQVPPGGAGVAPNRPPVQAEDQPKPAQPAPPPAGQTPAGQTPAGQPPAAPVTQPQTAAPRLTESGAFIMPNASLTELIELLAKRLKINYIKDPAVQGNVTIYTYGEVKPVDEMQLLETILRINGATIVKVGDLYRIVPMNRVSQLPLSPVLNADPKTLPDDERMILNLVFLKYATAAEIAKLMQPFLGEGGTVIPYEPANLLMIQDNARSMKRYMELLALFDSDTFAGQRVRLFEVENSRPSDLQKELESVFKAYALSDKAAAVKFMAVDRINTLIAVAPNPGIFAQVEEWIKKLDIAVKTSAGAVNTYVYRLKYARAETLAMAIMALYSGNTMALMALGQMNQMNNMMGGGMGGGMYPGAGGAYGGMNGMYGGGGGMGYPGMGYGGYGQGGYGQGGYGQMPYAASPPTYSASPLNPAGLNPPGTPGAGQTGTYLGDAAYGGAQLGPKIPHVIPNPFDNTLLIQGTPQEYDQITNLLRQLDIAPRQVLIDAKIYEVDLTGVFSAGVSAFLEKRDSSSGGAAARALNVATSAGGVTLTTGLLISQTKELLATITSNEASTRTRVISAPSIIATDSIAATMNVGTSVPTLTSQAVAGGVQQSGSSLFSNTVSTVSTGVTLNILARVNSSGIVTLIINQDISAPQPPANGGIQSPSFQNRSFQTQVTVQDGQMVAIGGVILESDGQTSSGVPLLHRIPLLGAAFGSKSSNKSRTELVVFITPRVIYDANQMIDATDEIKGNLKRLQKTMRDH
jgi:general secretion pathway protein D